MTEMTEALSTTVPLNAGSALFKAQESLFIFKLDKQHG